MPEAEVQPGAAPAPPTDPAAGFFQAPASDKLGYTFTPLDRTFLANIQADGTPAVGRPQRALLPADFQWTAGGVPQIPVPLCEFVAYKAALAYATPDVIERNLGRGQAFTFFDSHETKIAHTQGFGFADDGIVYIVLRGSEQEKSDWAINFDDDFTDRLRSENEKLLAKLQKRHGKVTASLVKRVQARPGRHVGFAIGWAAIHDKVETWLARFVPGTPIVLAGHSLGGALALIGASELKAQGHDVAAVVTFGAPLVGNQDFVTEYKALGLTERTVQFEAPGDLVPAVMRRWYYRIHQDLRDHVRDWLQPATATKTPPAFLTAGNPLAFAAQPPLTDREVVDAISSILAQKEREAREAKERARKEAEEKARPKEQPKPAPSVGAKPLETKGGATPSTSSTPGGSTGSDGNARIVILVIVSIVAVVGILIAWMVVRRKVASHAIIERYAVYLSTLSYQSIRSLRAGDPEPAPARLERANDDLARYLRYIRGEHTPAASYYREYFRAAKVAELPVRLKPDLDLHTFLSQSSNII